MSYYCSNCKKVFCFCEKSISIHNFLTTLHNIKEISESPLPVHFNESNILTNINVNCGRNKRKSVPEPSDSEAKNKKIKKLLQCDETMLSSPDLN